MPFLRRQVSEHGQPLINDVFAKYKAGVIDRDVFRRMEAEHAEAARVGGGSPAKENVQMSSAASPEGKGSAQGPVLYESSGGDEDLSTSLVVDGCESELDDGWIVK